jgi:hypothetical protein
MGKYDKKWSKTEKEGEWKKLIKFEYERTIGTIEMCVF